MGWKQALIRAISAEVAAEKAAEQAEDERRSTWWDTTWALADVPRAEWGQAEAEYVRRTHGKASTAKKRRLAGSRFPESSLAGTLPMPRFAQVAADWLGAKADDAKVREAVRLLTEAERNEQSLREFSQSLTGKSWTNAPENMTEADEDAVIEKVAKTRPHAIANQVSKPAVAKATMQNAAARKSMVESNRKPGKHPSMPTPKKTDPADKAEKAPNVLELQGMITEFHILAGDAADTRKITALYKSMEQYLTDEQRNDLAEIAVKVQDAWDMLRSVITTPVTDDALHDLIEQQQGG